MKVHDIQHPVSIVKEKKIRRKRDASLFHSDIWKDWMRNNGTTACCYGVRFKI